MSDGWSRALRAIAALAVDPAGLGGITLRARAGPVRQRVEEVCAALLPAPLHRLHPADPDDRLSGGLDVSASLAARRMVRTPGLAARPATLVLTMAERTEGAAAARLAQLLDARHGHGLVLLDEGTDDERAPACLRDRLAFDLALDGLSWRDTLAAAPGPEAIAAARGAQVVLPDGGAEALTAAALRLGIDSLRAPVLALRAARALAALDGTPEVTEAQLAEAAALVLAPRALHLPEEDPEDAAPPPPPEPGPGDAPRTETGDTPPHDMIIAAVTAALPDGLLDRLATPPAPRAAAGSGAGGQRKGNRRGRPLPSRPGRVDGRARIDLIATLRAAAPLQTLRHRARPDSAARVIVTPADIRLKRFEDRSDRLLIFAVDASGSAALARMAEAKGAVELFLARAYAKRDHVALIAFRGMQADVLLSPTRSLVQAKRQLAALPGGGGTPLASGLRAALALATTARHHGLSPALILLTDGRGNIALDGTPGRAVARAETEQIAATLAREALPTVVIDTANRPAEEGPALAGWLRARYLALPRADAQTLCRTADAALGA